MTCREFVEFLWRYLENELSPAERTIFDEHVADCPDCIEYVRQYQDTTRMGKETVTCSNDPVPSDVPEDLVQAILKAGRAIPNW